MSAFVRAGVLLFVALGVLALAPQPVAAAETPTLNWSVREATVSAARGQTIRVEVTTPVPERWHLYSAKVYGAGGPAVFATEIKPAQESETLVKSNGPITYPAPKIIKQDGHDIEVFETSATFTVPLKVNAAATPGDYKVTLVADAQLCSDNACVPVMGKQISFSLRVTDAPPVQETESPPAAAPPHAMGQQLVGTSDDIERARQEGLWAYLLLSMTLGFAALLTPCVFPMVPITVSFFTKRKHASRGRVILDAAVYGAGIVLTFVGLGFLFTLLLGATGVRVFASNPVVNLGLAAVFIAFAFNLFGAFEIQLPGFLLNRLNRASRQGQGLGAVLLMGLVFSLTSFTCTVPFVGASLFTATQGQFLWPIVGMLGFSFTFALPFFLMALFPSVLSSIPRSGEWLNAVKIVMGFLELAAALKFLSNTDLAWRWGIISRELFISMWIALAILTAVYLLGHIRFAHDTPVESIGALRAIFAAGFLALGLWLTTGLFGRSLGDFDAYVPPQIYPGEEAPARGETPLTWHDDWDAAFAEAKRTGQPLFVDFTGLTCTNCRWMEANMFPNPEVRRLLGKYVRVHLYTDDRHDAKGVARSQANERLQQSRYQTVALPFYALVSPDGNDIATFPGLTRDPDEFAAFLRKGLKP